MFLCSAANWGSRFIDVLVCFPPLAPDPTLTSILFSLSVSVCVSLSPSVSVSLFVSVSLSVPVSVCPSLSLSLSLSRDGVPQMQELVCNWILMPSQLHKFTSRRTKTIVRQCMNNSLPCALKTTTNPEHFPQEYAQPSSKLHQSQVDHRVYRLSPNTSATWGI